MHRLPGSLERYKQKHLLPTVKKAGSVMVWGCFSGNGGRGGLYFLPQNETMNSKTYLEVLKDHLVLLFRTHKCKFFHQDSAPCHKSKVVTACLKEHKILCIDWPGNSPDLNPIENVWSIMKGRMSQNPCKNRGELIDRLKHMWVKEMKKYLFVKLAKSMPRRIQAVLSVNGGHTKY